MRLAEGMTFAVLDLETTGVLPRSDRVVEVAVVRMDRDGNRLGEMATLVNPRRDVGDTTLHGVSATDVLSAPTFGEVLGDVVALLSGAVVVGHNVRFDLRFLEIEARRAGYALPAVPSLCTLYLSRRVAGPLPSRRLAVCCEHAGFAHDEAHDALMDAIATARLLVHYRQGAQGASVRDSHPRRDGALAAARSRGVMRRDARWRRALRSGDSGARPNRRVPRRRLCVVASLVLSPLGRAHDGRRPTRDLGSR